MNHSVVKALLGDWISDIEDVKSSLESEKQKLEFTEDGRLIYTIISENKDQKVFLTYRVEDHILITNQPSHPREERTRFSFTPDGKLVLVYGDYKSTYVRF